MTTRHKLADGFGHGLIQPLKFQGFSEKPVTIHPKNPAMAKSVRRMNPKKQSTFASQISFSNVIGSPRNPSQFIVIRDSKSSSKT